MIVELLSKGWKKIEESFPTDKIKILEEIAQNKTLKIGESTKIIRVINFKRKNFEKNIFKKQKMVNIIISFTYSNKKNPFYFNFKI